MTAVGKNELLGVEVAAKLGRLRASLTARLALEGLAWTVLALVALVFVTLAFDYYFRLERELRGVIMALAGIGVAAVVWRELIGPLRVPMDAADLALLVERRFTQLGDRLIGAVQFGRRSGYESLGISRAMVARMADEANRLAGPLPFGQIVERRGIFRTWALAGCAVGVLLGFGIWQSETLAQWFKRNVLFAEAPWPQSTYLQVVGGPDFRVLRGEDLTVAVVVEPHSTDTPSHVTLHARYPSIGKTEERLAPDPQDPRRFVKVFPAVPEEFRFYVTGGDDRRDRRRPHRVLLIDPPAFRRVQFTVGYPRYMDRPRPGRFDGGTGALSVPVGAKVTVEAEANKDLASAEILLDGKPAGRMQPQAIRRDGQVHVLARRFVGSFEIAGENKPAARVLRFALRDTAGHANRRGAKYVLQVRPDHAPSVDLKKRGIGVRISPRAMIPLDLRIKDDYGVASADVLARPSAAGKKAVTQAVQFPAGQAAAVKVRHVLDIEPLALSPGATLHIAARSADRLPKTFGGPNVGASSEMTFRLVKAEDLMSDLVRRQKEVRLEFVQAMALQESARANMAAAAQASAGGGEISPEARRLLQSSAGFQSSVGAEVAKAADTLAAIVEEMANNRVGTETGREQIRAAIVKPLRDLTAPIRTVTGTIQATRSVDAANELKQQAEAIEDVQADLLRQMDEILKRMAKLESKQELANRLQLIIKWSRDLLQTIKKKQDAEVGKVFDPTTKPAREEK